MADEELPTLAALKQLSDSDRIKQAEEFDSNGLTLYKCHAVPAIVKERHAIKQRISSSTAEICAGLRWHGFTQKQESFWARRTAQLRQGGIQPLDEGVLAKFAAANENVSILAQVEKEDNPVLRQHSRSDSGYISDPASPHAERAAIVEKTVQQYQQLQSNDIKERMKPAEDLTTLLSTDGRVLFEYHAFQLPASFVTEQAQARYTVRLTDLWDNIGQEEQGYWRECTKKLCINLEYYACGKDHLELEVGSKRNTTHSSAVGRVVRQALAGDLEILLPAWISQAEPSNTLYSATFLQITDESSADSGSLPTDENGSGADHDLAVAARYPRSGDVSSIGTSSKASHTSSEVPTDSLPQRDFRPPNTAPASDHIVNQHAALRLLQADPTWDTERVDALRVLENLATLIKDHPDLHLKGRVTGVRIDFDPKCKSVSGIRSRLASGTHRHLTAFRAGQPCHNTAGMFTWILQAFFHWNRDHPAIRKLQEKARLSVTFTASQLAMLSKHYGSCLEWLQTRPYERLAPQTRHEVIAVIMDALRKHVKGIGAGRYLKTGRWSISKDNSGFAEQLLDCFDATGLSHSEYEDLLEQRFYALHQATDGKLRLTRETVD